MNTDNGEAEWGVGRGKGEGGSKWWRRGKGIERGTEEEKVKGKV